MLVPVFKHYLAGNLTADCEITLTGTMVEDFIKPHHYYYIGRDKGVSQNVTKTWQDISFCSYAGSYFQVQMSLNFYILYKKRYFAWNVSEINHHIILHVSLWHSKLVKISSKSTINLEWMKWQKGVFACIEHYSWDRQTDTWLNFNICSYV